MPFRFRNNSPKQITSPPFPGDIINAMKKFDFAAISQHSVAELTKLFSDYRQKEHPRIYLGKVGIISYGFAPEVLAPGSLNTEDVAVPQDDSARELLKNLRFLDPAGKETGSPRLALALGRLWAQHFNPDRVSQSHWIVFLDQTQCFWACYAYGIADEDIKMGNNGQPGPYLATCDTAFGANKEQDQKVVFLGSLNEMPFHRDNEFSAKVHNLDWSTSQLSEEQKSKMAEEDAKVQAARDNEVAELKAKQAKSYAEWKARHGINDILAKDSTVKEEPCTKASTVKDAPKKDSGVTEDTKMEDSTVCKEADTTDLSHRSAVPDELPDAPATATTGFA